MFSEAGERQHSLDPSIPIAATNGNPHRTLRCSKSLYLILTIFYFLQDARMSAQVPRVAGFARQREALGLESMLYAYIALGLARNLILPQTLTLKKSLTLTHCTL